MHSKILRENPIGVPSLFEAELHIFVSVRNPLAAVNKLLGGSRGVIALTRRSNRASITFPIFREEILKTVSHAKSTRSATVQSFIQLSDRLRRLHRPPVYLVKS